MSNISDTKRLRIQRNKSTVIALALTLTLAATIITALPLAFGQEEEEELGRVGTIDPLISLTIDRWVGPQPVGVNQDVLIEAVLRPRPLGYQQDPALSEHNIYEGVVFMITKADGTVENVTMDTDDRGEVWFWYTCTQTGTYNLDIYWAGDKDHYSVIREGYPWIVQSESVAPLEKIRLLTFLDVTYDIVGRGQRQYIIGWLSPPREVNSGLYYELEFTITKPSGATITHVQDTDTPATASFGILCDETGTWSVKFSYAGDELHNSVESEPATWTVQEEQVPPEPQQPLPDYPWEFPVSAEYWEWYQISGPWKGTRAGNIEGIKGSSFNPYTTAPNTPHVLWKLPMEKGGILGGETGYMSWDNARHILRLRDDPMEILTFVAAQGRLYFNSAESYTLDGEDVGTHPVLYCLDQYTGELIYRRDLHGPGTGGEPQLVMENAFKFDPQLVAREIRQFSIWLTSGGLWEIDPWTGNTFYYNPDLSGTLYEDAIYMNNYPKEGNLTKWDLTTHSIVWTTTAPIDDWEVETKFPSVFGEGYGISLDRPRGEIPHASKLWTWNLTTGELIVDGVVLEDVYSPGGSPRLLQDGKIYVSAMDGIVRGFDVTTGSLEWTSEPADYPWADFTPYQQASSWGQSGGGRSQLYVPSWDGYLYAYDTANGERLWRAFTKNTTEAGMGHFLPWAAIVIADNKVYFSCGEHSPPQPLPRGGQLYCVDAVTGERIWTLDGFYSHVWTTRHLAGASGGMFWYVNRYDNSMYMFGKGETATTVEASPKVVAKGASVLIEGTVTDQSPGAKDTPAVSDDSQADWMEYLYMNKPMPSDCEGVSVTLQAMRSDHTVIDLAVVTTDILGHFEYLWTPDSEDTYKILATFEGSESYWTSSAECGLGVTEAAGPSGPIEPEPTADYTIAIVAAVVAVVVVALVAVWAIRRRK